MPEFTRVAILNRTDHGHVLGRVLGAGCDAVWPGWGFVSEDADFVERVAEAGLTFIGPSMPSLPRLTYDRR
ncbi:MAG TPA: biotin carboxylase N-terminal domain-containing protein [Acidimicrobiales bacterium]|nr:biotin carboxylase N-terminal domain-containing protein [Acidimicrobiales bacterium]